jgi:hypothetical protein
MNFKAFIALILVLVLAVWGYVRYEAAQTGDTYFNQTTRYALGKSDFWRWVLNLNRVGDAKGQFLAGDEPIVIEVLMGKGLEINEEGLNKFVSEVERATGRKTDLINVDFADLNLVKDSDLPNLITSFRRHRIYGRPDLFIIYAKDFEGSQGVASKPFNAFGILVSDQKLKDLTSYYSQAVRDYLPAVLLNSFGQQLGLSQSHGYSCIMQDLVLHPNSALIFSGPALPTKYCDSEIEQAKQIGESLK